MIVQLAFFMSSISLWHTAVRSFLSSSFSFPLESENLLNLLLSIGNTVLWVVGAVEVMLVTEGVVRVVVVPWPMSSRIDTVVTHGTVAPDTGVPVDRSGREAALDVFKMSVESASEPVLVGFVDSAGNASLVTATGRPGVAACVETGFGIDTLGLIVVCPDWGASIVVCSLLWTSRVVVALLLDFVSCGAPVEALPALVATASVVLGTRVTVGIVFSIGMVGGTVVSSVLLVAEVLSFWVETTLPAALVFGIVVVALVVELVLVSIGLVDLGSSA